MHDGQKTVHIDPATPESDLVENAGKIIQNNGVVIFPTQCLYGVAANALSKKAVQKVFNVKKRPKSNPILVLIPDRTLLLDLVKSIPGPADKLMDVFWPGNLTIIFEAKATIPGILTAGTGKIGIRIPVHPVAKALVEYIKFPITATSANLSGQEGCSQPNLLNPYLLEHADLVLDAGVLKGGTGSTIVDMTCSTPQVLRVGIVSEGSIHKILEN